MIPHSSPTTPHPFVSAQLEQLKNSFFNTSIPAGLLCCDAGKGFALYYVNDFFVKLLGYQSQSDFLSATNGLFVNCLVEGEDIAKMETAMQELPAEGHCSFTYRVKTKAGGELCLREYTHKYSENGTSALLCFCMDISDMVKLENNLKEQKNQLEFANAEIQTIVSNIPGGVHRCQLFDRVHVDYVSHGFEELSGYTQAEIHTLFQDNYSLMLVQEDRAAFGQQVRRLLSEPVSCILEYRMRRKNGQIIRVVDHFRSVRTEDGLMWGFGVAIDVTAQHDAVAQLQLLTDSIPGGLVVYEYSPRGLHMEYFSDGVCAMVGYTRDEYESISKNRLSSMMLEEDMQSLRPKIQALLSPSANSIDCVYRHRTKQGGYRWLNARGTVADRLGDTIRVNAVLLDITDQKKAEDKLRIRDEEYRLAIAQSGKVVYRYTVSDKSVYMLQKDVDLFGFPSSAQNVPESIIALHIFAPESEGDLADFYGAISNGQKSGSATLRRKFKHGGFGWCLAHFTTLFSSTGEPVSAVISIEDVTQLHEQAAENAVLRQNEELFQIVVSHSDRFIVKYNPKTHTAYLQPHTAAVLCLDEVVHNMPDACVKNGTIAKESAEVYLKFYEKLMAGEPTAKAVVKRRKNGTSDQWGWYSYDGSVVFDDKKQPAYAVISFVEITAQYEKELAYERMSQHINLLSKDALLYIEANLSTMKVTRAQGCGIFHSDPRLYEDPTALLAAAIDELIVPDRREDLRRFFDREALLADFAHNKPEKKMEVCICYKEQFKWVCITVEMIADPYTEDILIYVLFQDIDKVKAEELRILKRSQTDEPTGLYNKVTIERQIRELLQAKPTALCALAIIDVDDLKAINDTFGHLQGDLAIRAFADTLRHCFDKQALLGRIGGDEFLIFVPELENEQSLIDAISAVTQNLYALHVGAQKEHTLHGSIGVVIHRQGQADFESLYQKADTALYYVKRHGKNNYAINSEAL
ncbi:MAG: sensor domain-containing diguanylate cyclase [Clostridia bacterium]